MTLDELQALCDAATPGPWTNAGTYVQTGVHCAHGPMHRTVHNTEPPYAQERADRDGDFIVAAREYMPKLIARVREFEIFIQDKIAPCTLYDKYCVACLGEPCGRCKFIKSSIEARRAYLYLYGE